MPLDFEHHDGLDDAELRLARLDHPVEATGVAKVLGTMIPAFEPTRLANGRLLFQLRQIQWLLLVVIWPGDDVPASTLLFGCIIHVRRLGEP